MQEKLTRAMDGVGLHERFPGLKYVKDWKGDSEKRVEKAIETIIFVGLGVAETILEITEEMESDFKKLPKF